MSRSISHILTTDIYYIYIQDELGIFFPFFSLSTQSFDVIDLVIVRTPNGHDHQNGTLTTTYLFHSFGRKYNGVIFSHADAVLNSYPHSTEPRRPSIIVGNIDTAAKD